MPLGPGTSAMGVSTALDTDGNRGWPSPTSCGPLPLSYFVIPARPHPKTVKEKAPPDHSGGAHFVWADGREAYSSPSPSGRSSTITSSDVKSDRTSVVEGKSVAVRVDLGGRRSLKKKKKYEEL